MAKKSRATFHKRDKEKARQHKQHDKAQRRLTAKERRAASALPSEGEEPDVAGIHPGLPASLEQWDEAKSAG
jgi:hypothetical protein